MYLKAINKLLSISLMFLVVCSCSFKEPQINLKKQGFKVGVFEAVNGGTTYVIKREYNYQIEKIVGVVGEIKYKINWINNRKYSLLYDSNTLLNEVLSDKYSNIRDTITIELTKIKGSFYYFKSTFKGKESYGRMKKVD